MKNIVQIPNAVNDFLSLLYLEFYI